LGFYCKKRIFFTVKFNASIVAFNKATGKEQWRALNDPVSYSAPIVIDQAGKRGGVCWSHPAFAYKHVFVRNDEELLCADLSAKE